MQVSELLESYRGEGYTRGEGCLLPAHYAELQALCDALGYAAQQEMAWAAERGDDAAREHAYGKWLGLRGILRAVEGRMDEWTPQEREMLALIDWSTPRFRFPGIEAFEVAPVRPGGDGTQLE